MMEKYECSRDGKIREIKKKKRRFQKLSVTDVG